MMRLLLLAASVCCLAHAGTDPGWQPAEWHGERALVSTSPGWKAIVSLERGRLMHFGPGDTDTNLLFAPTTRDDPAGWGGHRVWLGPQASWPAIWPPPDPWEHSGPESFTVIDGILRLKMKETGGGWPRLTRTYQWVDTRLVCGVELSGGTRSVQIIQIVQVPKTSTVDVVPQPDKKASHGYVLLPSSADSRLTTDFAPPPHATVAGAGLVLRHVGLVKKLGFPPQTLIAHERGFELRVSREVQNGMVAGEPDAGYSTQLYLGGPEPFIELEQLSPIFSTSAPVSFTMGLEGAAH